MLRNPASIMIQMSDGGEAVTVRLLPDGAPEPACIKTSKRHELLLSSANGGSGPVFKPGALIEIQSPSAIYLGAVLRQEDRGLLVAVEHSIDRASLAEIERVWGSPEEG